jgi:hypothetical protein
LTIERFYGTYHSRQVFAGTADDGRTIMVARAKSDLEWQNSDPERLEESGPEGAISANQGLT